jgi:RND family efflux transporter MFP subunit
MLQPLTRSRAPRVRAPRRVAFAAMAMAIVLAACHAEEPKAAGGSGSAGGGAPRAIKTAPVVRVEGGEAAVPGTVRARNRAALSSRISASVVEVPHREGERVAAGAVVVRLDATALRSAVAAAEAGMKAAEAERRRVESLLEKGAATPRESDDATARAAAAQAAWEGAKDGLAYAVLRAPFAGRIGRMPVDVGDVVSPGATLVEIEGEGGFELQATTEGSIAASLRPGFEAKATVDGLPSPLGAVVRSVSPAGDPTTHRFDVRADLRLAAGLRSGLFARLLLPSATAEPRLVVPAGAVMERGGLSGVFVVAEGQARLRWIARGEVTGEKVEVRAGLEAGERVALDPAGLTDGMPVAEER